MLHIFLTVEGTTGDERIAHSVPDESVCREILTHVPFAASCLFACCLWPSWFVALPPCRFMQSLLPTITQVSFSMNASQTLPLCLSAV